MLFTQIRNQKLSFVKEFAIKIDFKDLKFPVHKKDYAKIEKQNNIQYLEFGYEDGTAYRICTSKQTLKNWLVLLLLSNFKNSQCILVKYFNTFMTNTRKHHGKKHFVNIAYNAFLAQENQNVI